MERDLVLKCGIEVFEEKGFDARTFLQAVLDVDYARYIRPLYDMLENAYKNIVSTDLKKTVAKHYDKFVQIGEEIRLIESQCLSLQSETNKLFEELNKIQDGECRGGKFAVPDQNDGKKDRANGSVCTLIDANIFLGRYHQAIDYLVESKAEMEAIESAARRLLEMVHEEFRNMHLPRPRILECLRCLERLGKEAEVCDIFLETRSEMLSSKSRELRACGDMQRYAHLLSLLHVQTIRNTFDCLSKGIEMNQEIMSQFVAWTNDQMEGFQRALFDMLFSDYSRGKVIVESLEAVRTNLEKLDQMGLGFHFMLSDTVFGRYAEKYIERSSRIIQHRIENMEIGSLSEQPSNAFHNMLTDHVQTVAQLLGSSMTKTAILSIIAAIDSYVGAVLEEFYRSGGKDNQWVLELGRVGDFTGQLEPICNGHGDCLDEVEKLRLRLEGTSDLMSSI